ncbi:nucleotidyl transferase AbiEii/AbiGii toxin family protein [Leeia oryzae]|uniref:nucleotidyl transferase AbiEii/AbiGii toxin family protein n=1 Tax=Leeia oryzae TaxID=356662 RepID=UPI00037DD792|nr:nucleotidyl transferase AbiEii/AbiGii toxin family protein [Leeia oryzae]
MSPRTILTDRPIDPITIAILREVAEVATTADIAHMLVGATARDVLLTHVFGLETTRATYDIDFAVAVKDWEQFDALCSGLIERKTFKGSGRAKQRLYYKGEKGEFDYHIDLVPFGAIAKGTMEIAWPPDMKTIMNVAGYEEVLAAAEWVEFAPGLIQKVVSIAGLAILKIFAWSDRGRENPKDAQDLAFIMKSYAAAGNFERVYEIEGVIEAGDYDPDLAGIYLLGLDIRRMVEKETLDQLRQIIERDFERLLVEMIRSRRYRENVEVQVRAQLRLLKQGITGSG